jgi:hypothetical protein
MSGPSTSAAGSGPVQYTVRDDLTLPTVNHVVPVALALAAHKSANLRATVNVVSSTMADQPSQIPVHRLGWKHYQERARNVPYYFGVRMGCFRCTFHEIKSAMGSTLISQCPNDVCARNVMGCEFLNLYCWDHKDKEDPRCPCPLPIDGSRCSNMVMEHEHYCAEADAVYNCGAWYNDLLIGTLSLVYSSQQT